MRHAMGEDLERPCTNPRHGMNSMVFGSIVLALHQFDPECTTCVARDMLSEHDHLHLDPDFVCKVPGINGRPGVNVKCQCGAFHH